MLYYEHTRIRPKEFISPISGIRANSVIRIRVVRTGKDTLKREGGKVCRAKHKVNPWRRPKRKGLLDPASILGGSKGEASCAGARHNVDPRREA